MRNIVEFMQRNNGVSTRTSGIGVGKFLAVAYPNKYNEAAVQIFNTLTGKPLFNLYFPSDKKGITDAVKVARWIDEVYGYYLEIPTAKGFEDANIIALCQWTVKNGIQVRIAFENLERLHSPDDFITADHVTGAFELAAAEVKDWIRFVKPR